MRVRLGLWIAFALCLLPPVARAGEVRMEVRADGRKVIVNETSTQRARRLSGTLVAVPDVEIEPLIAQHADNHLLDPKLVRAVIQVESGYNVRALSRKGAMGLMQLTGPTAASLAVHDPYDPDQNLRGGTAYLRRLLDRFQGNLELALAAYNAGPGAVERYGGIPPYAETRDYVRRVLSLYRGTEVALAAATLGPVRKMHVVRGANNRILLTTSPAVKK